MKKIKMAVCILLCACMAVTFSACSITDLFDRLVNGTSKSKENDADVPMRTEEEVFTRDANIEAPVFAESLSGTTTVPQGQRVVLDATASVSDGGTLTYQWYHNAVNSNSGGTVIEGANQPLYSAETSELSDDFYFCVVCNTQGKTYNSSTSDVREVVVRQVGEFTVDELGGTRYLSPDGTYPVNLWMDIDGNTYHFTDVGYTSTGWLEDNGKMYYFDETTAVLMRNYNTPDGHITDKDGAMVVFAQAEEEVPEGEAPAEGAPEGETPAEGGEPAPEENSGEGQE